MTNDKNIRVANILQELVATHGVIVVLGNVAWLRSRFADLSLSSDADAYVAILALQEGIVHAVNRAHDHGARSEVMAHGIDRLVDRYSVDRDVASDVVGAWASACGLALSGRYQGASSPASFDTGRARSVGQISDHQPITGIDAEVLARRRKDQEAELESRSARLQEEFQRRAAALEADFRERQMRFAAEMAAQRRALIVEIEQLSAGLVSSIDVLIKSGTTRKDDLEGEVRASKERISRAQVAQATLDEQVGVLRTMQSALVNVTVPLTPPLEHASLAEVPVPASTQHDRSRQALASSDVVVADAPSFVPPRRIPAEAELRPGANLSDCDLSNRNLHGVDLSRADLSNANLSGSNLSNARLYFANLKGINAISARFIEANLRFADLTGANLVAADFSSAELSMVTLTDAVLTGAKFAGAKLAGTRVPRGFRINA